MKVGGTYHRNIGKGGGAPEVGNQKSHDNGEKKFFKSEKKLNVKEGGGLHSSKSRGTSMQSTQFKIS